MKLQTLQTFWDQNKHCKHAIQWRKKGGFLSTKEKKNKSGSIHFWLLSGAEMTNKVYLLTQLSVGYFSLIVCVHCRKHAMSSHLVTLSNGISQERSLLFPGIAKSWQWGTITHRSFLPSFKKSLPWLFPTFLHDLLRYFWWGTPIYFPVFFPWS